MESGATAWSASAQTVLPLGGREGLGASEQADEHLAFACEFHDANEMPLWEARGQLGWAEALAARGETAAARDHAARALELSREYGYGAFEPRAAALVEAQSAAGT